ncbi:MAG: type II toxin-antitoxin system RelE/ParE family toxin [Gammaproteobacteria bacterium]
MNSSGNRMKVRLTKRARADLVCIAEYTEENWGRIQRNKYLLEIDRRLKWLAENPSAGIQRPDIKEGYFCYPQGRHLIFFMKSLNHIDIIGIIHQEMDLHSWLEI